MNRMVGFVLAGLFSTSPSVVSAAGSNIQFSAQTVQSTEDGEMRTAQMYVGDNQVRMQYRQDGQEMAEIYDMKHQRALLLVPGQSTYMERRMPKGGMRNPMLPPAEVNPCSMMPNAECTQLGAESLFGRQAMKWEMVSVEEGKTLRSLHWIDVDRKMPLRNLWPDGSISETRPTGTATLNGRLTERWEMSTTYPDGHAMKVQQWYDPELQFAVREELPGGYFRELRNIKIAPQADHLFTVPAGYRQVQYSPPSPEPRATGAQQPPTRSAAPYPGR